LFIKKSLHALYWPPLLVQFTKHCNKYL